MEASFRVSGSAVEVSPWARGPWRDDLQHGGASAGLIASALIAEKRETPMQLMRLTLDLRPVPIRPLTLATLLRRRGRKSELWSAALFDGENEVARASALYVRDVDLPTPASRTALELPLPEQCAEATGCDPRLLSPFVEAVDMRIARGGLDHLGPAAAWYRLNRPIIEGVVLAPEVRAAVCADFANGASAPLDSTAWSFPNADLTLNIFRPRRASGFWLRPKATSTRAAQGARARVWPTSTVISATPL